VAALRPDLIHVQSIHITEYFNDVATLKVLDMVDVFSQNMARRAAVAPFPRNLLYQREARLLHAYEAAVLRRYERVMLVSRADAAAHPAHDFCINPNGTRITAENLLASAIPPRPNAIVFHGNLSYAPNVDAARFLCRDVLPRLRDTHPTLVLYLVGYDPAPAVRALHDGGRVIVTGGVADIVPHLTGCALGVYPLRLGSGMPNKVLDALACGLACVVSPLAVAGIAHARAGTHLAVATDAASWAETIRRLLADSAERARLAQRGQAMVRAEYTWERNVAILRDTWQAVLSPNPRDFPAPLDSVARDDL
jgi:glycosyltransferase involved in cell wall biosynthesis